MAFLRALDEGPIIIFTASKVCNFHKRDLLSCVFAQKKCDGAKWKSEKCSKGKELARESHHKLCHSEWIMRRAFPFKNRFPVCCFPFTLRGGVLIYVCTVKPPISPLGAYFFNPPGGGLICSWGVGGLLEVLRYFGNSILQEDMARTIHVMLSFLPF